MLVVAGASQDVEFKKKQVRSAIVGQGPMLTRGPSDTYHLDILF